MPATTPFLCFEDKFHNLSQAVSESQQKLSPVAAQAVVDLAIGDLCRSLFEFCGEQFQAIRKLRPTIVRRREIGGLTSGKEINDLFRSLVRRNLVSVKETNELTAIARYNRKSSSNAVERKTLRLEWTKTSDFLFDLAVQIARETGIAAKRGLDVKTRKQRETIVAVSRLLAARYDTLA